MIFEEMLIHVPLVQIQMFCFAFAQEELEITQENTCILEI